MLDFLSINLLRKWLLLGVAAFLFAAPLHAQTVVNSGTGVFAAALNQTLYSVNFDTGKATVLFTDTGVAGINSVGFDPVKAIYYYADNASATTNRSIYGYDTRTQQRFVLIADVTTIPGVVLGGSGMGSAGGEFANGSFYFSTENGGPGNADQFYKVDFVPASNGRTVQSISLVGYDNFTGNTNFGDFLIDEATQRIYAFNSGVGVDEYSINNNNTVTYIGQDALPAVRQAARDRNNVFYSVGDSVQTYNPATGALGSARLITTNGTTNLGAVADAGAYLPAQSSIGGRAFFDANSNGVDEPDPAASGLTVELYDDLDGDGALDAGETLLATATTNSNGEYLFTQILPGDYLIRIVDPTDILNGATATTAGGFVQSEKILQVGFAATDHDFGFNDNRPTLTTGNIVVTEGITPFAVFTVALSRTYTAPISISLALADGSAGASDYGPGLEVSTDGGTNYTPATTATFATGATSIRVRTPIANDALYELTENFTLTATRTAGNAANSSATGFATISDNDPQPSFSVDDVSRNEAGGTATFTITLSAASAVTSSVNFATANGTATAGSDYDATSGLLTFPAGTTSQQVIVTINNDAIYEASETFALNLSGATNAGISDNSGVGTILDNGMGDGGTDNDRPTLSLSNPTVIEANNAFAVFTASLSNASAAATTFSLALANGSATGTDYGPGLEVSTDSGANWTSATSATIAPGLPSVLIRTPVANDTLDENAETFTLTATVSGGATTNASALGTATITDDDAAPTISIDNVTRNEGAATAVFTVSLSTASGLPISVNFATADGSASAGNDYTATSGTLNFAAGVASQQVTVALLNDTVFEGSETFAVDLTAPTNATLADGSGTGTLLDDGTGGAPSDNDLPVVSVSNTAATEAPGAYATFTVSLSNESVLTTTFALTLANGTASAADYGPGLQVSLDNGANWTNSTTGAFAPGTTSVLVRTPVADDTLDESAETFTLTATRTAGSTSNASAFGTATINDDDAPPAVSINDVSVAENVSPASFTVSLSTASGLAVTVNYTTANGTATAGADYTTRTGTVTFAPGTTSQLVDVTVLDDTTYEPNENFSVVLSAPANATIADGTGVGTIVENDPKPNDPPVAVADAATTAEDTAVTITVLTNDTDLDNDPLTVTSANVPAAQGTVSVNGDNTLLFTPALNFNGPATITYTISDGKGGTDSTSVAVTVTAVNDNPVAVNDTTTTPEDTAVTTSVLVNDSDVDNDPLTVTAATLSTGQGTVSHTTTGVTFTPALNFNGPATIAYSISDGQGGTASAVVTITVTSVNDNPVAVTDNASTPEDTAVTITVLTNDTDADNDPLTVTSATVPAAQGTVSVNGDNTLLYTPALNFNGFATITYFIADGQGGTASTTVSVALSPANDAPVAVNDTNTTAEETAVTTSVLVNDSDVDGGPLVITFAQISTGRGNVTNDGTTLTFTPERNFTGTATIAYFISDGRGGNAQAVLTVTVTPVNDAPFAADDTTVTPEDTAILVPVLANDFDVDGDTLSISSVTLTRGSGTVAISGTNVLFTPTANFNGDAYFTYTISDGNGSTAGATGLVVVTPVNDAPVATDDTAITPAGRPIAVSVLGNDLDTEAGTLSVTAVSLVDGRGTVGINPDGTVEFTPATGFTGDATILYTVQDPQGGTAFATIRITVDGLPIATDDKATTTINTAKQIPVLINDLDPEGLPLTITSATILPIHGALTIAPNGRLLYTPAADLVGTASGSYTIQDAAGNIATAQVSIDITRTVAPEPPVAQSDSVSTTQQTPVTIAVLQNDNNPAGGSLTITSATVPASQGTVVINPNGTLTFTAAPGFSGTTSIEYTIQNTAGATASAPVLIVVDGGNAAPIAKPDTATAATSTPKIVRLLLNDTDPDGDIISVVSATISPAQGTVQANPDGTVTFTSAPTFTGTASIAYQITDGQGGTSNSTISVTVSATVVNTPPVAPNDTAATGVDQPINIPVLLNDRDADGDLLTVTNVSVPPGQGTVTINPDNSIRFVPAPGFNDDVILTYTVDDGQGGTTSALVTVNVNDNPLAVGDRTSTLPGTPVTVVLLVNDSDPNGNPITLADASSDPAEGTLVINADGTVRFTPAPGFTGVAEVSYTITDGQGGSAEGTVYITVNTPPAATPDVASTSIDQPLDITVLTNDTDDDGDPLTVVAATVDPTQGTVVINSDGTITFTPAPTFTGPAVITYTISDSNGDEQTSTVTITRDNIVPVANGRTVYTYCKTEVRVNVLRTATDGDGDILTPIAVSQPRFGKVTILPNGMISYRPKSNYKGTTTDTFTVTLSDGKGGTVTQTITVRDFAALGGTFQGLLEDAPAPNQLPPFVDQPARGRVTITLNDRASFTAKVELDGGVFRFIGTLRGALTYQRTLKVAGKKVLVTLTYNDLTDSWTSTLAGEDVQVKQEVAGIPRRPTTRRVASKHTVQLQPRDGVTPPTTALVRVSKTGVVTMTGKLPDGIAFSSSARLNAQDVAPIYDWMPKVRSSVAGAVQIALTPSGSLERLDATDNTSIYDLQAAPVAP